MKTVREKVYKLTFLGIDGILSQWHLCLIHSAADQDKVQSEAQANAKWIIQHTKPCPNCR